MLTLLWVAASTIAVFTVVVIALTIADVVKDRRESLIIANAALGAFSIRK